MDAFISDIEEAGLAKIQTTLALCNSGRALGYSPEFRKSTWGELSASFLGNIHHQPNIPCKAFEYHCCDVWHGKGPLIQTLIHRYAAFPVLVVL